jgi:hypothetical protein
LVVETIWASIHPSISAEAVRVCRATLLGAETIQTGPAVRALPGIGCRHCAQIAVLHELGPFLSGCRTVCLKGA